MNMTTTHSGTLSPKPSWQEREHSALARTLAAEGIVLLKNDALLPLNPANPLALLGAGAVRTVKGGTGSGDVNNRESIALRQGMEENNVPLTSTDWLNDYEARYRTARETWKAHVLSAAEHYENPFDAYAENPFALPDGRAITLQDLIGARAAVYVLSRIAGEGRDRRMEPGDYLLSAKEWEDLRFLNGQSIPTVLVLNTGGPVELTDVLEQLPAIRSVVYLSQPGQEGGRAAADVLLGRVCPSGHLTSTWARRYADYPGSDTFGCLNGDVSSDTYREGIYLGYRYFDSFDVQPLFPFGFGLSYTSFFMVLQSVERDGNNLLVSAWVRNSGTHRAGKAVVQLYLTPPQTGEGQELRRLAGFAKTDLLAPGESRSVTITVPQRCLAHFSETHSGWVVEQGTYGLWLGSDSRDCQPVQMIQVPETVLLRATSHICPPARPISERLPGDRLTAQAKEWTRRAELLHIPTLTFTPTPETPPVCPAPEETDIPTPALVPLLFGNITEGASTLGSSGTRVPGSAGETSQRLEREYDLTSLIMADGPAGLRLRQFYQVDRATDRVYGAGVLGSLENGFLEPPVPHENADTYYQYCTAFPVGTALAQSWNPALMERFGEAIGREMKTIGVHIWLAPGMNLHRNPLCGRNFEYYSEDPLLTGRLAAAVCRGVQSQPGCAVTVKHFACNHQEDNRMGVDVRLNERALRELYLRGFEIAIREGRPRALMTSYNRINGVHSANNRDLCTTVAREEWGFDGVILSDWNTTVPADGSVPWRCAAAGNDIIMPGNPRDEENIRAALSDGSLTERAVRACAERVIRLIRTLTAN